MKELLAPEGSPALNNTGLFAQLFELAEDYFSQHSREQPWIAGKSSYNSTGLASHQLVLHLQRLFPVHAL